MVPFSLTNNRAFLKRIILDAIQPLKSLIPRALSKTPQLIPSTSRPTLICVWKFWQLRCGGIRCCRRRVESFFPHRMEGLAGFYAEIYYTYIFNKLFCLGNKMESGETCYGDELGFEKCPRRLKIRFSCVLYTGE